MEAGDGRADGVHRSGGGGVLVSARFARVALVRAHIFSTAVVLHFFVETHLYSHTTEVGLFFTCRSN